MVENVNNEVQPVVESVNNNSINNSVSDVPSVEVAPTEVVNNEQTTVNEQDDIFPDNQPNTEQNGDSSPLEDLFNNNTNNN